MLEFYWVQSNLNVYTQQSTIKLFLGEDELEGIDTFILHNCFNLYMLVVELHQTVFLETWFHINMESYISFIEWICFVFWHRRNVNCNYFQFIVYPFLFLLFWWYMSKIAGQGNYSLQIIFDLCWLSEDNAINILESRFSLGPID